MPSTGQPAPVVGSQFGDEYGRSPTSVMSVDSARSRLDRAIGQVQGDSRRNCSCRNEKSTIPGKIDCKRDFRAQGWSGRGVKAQRTAFPGKLFGDPGKSSIRAGFGIFYNRSNWSLNNSSAEPAFGGSSIVFLITDVQFGRSVQERNIGAEPPFKWHSRSPTRSSAALGDVRRFLLYGQAPPSMRSQSPSNTPHDPAGSLQRIWFIFRLLYGGTPQGHRLLGPRK